MASPTTQEKPALQAEQHLEKHDTSKHDYTLDDGTSLDSARTEEIQQVEMLIADFAARLQTSNIRPGRWALSFAKPKHFTWLMAIFASMGGLLFGLDQSLISGANLFLPRDLNLTTQQVGFMSSGVPLGAVAGAIMLSPVNEYLGRRNAIVAALVLYTIGAALEAGSISYPMILISRLILGFGVGIETGTVPVYVAESVDRSIRGNLVSLYQFNIALGEVLGYVVAAIFLKVPGNWRYMLGSSVVFSVVMLVGMLFLPESPRFLLHKSKDVEAFAIWKRIRGLDTFESKMEFYLMVMTARTEEEETQAHKATVRFVWMDFFTVPRCRRAIVYANTMILLGQFVGINGIMYYMATLMGQVGFNTAESTYMSMVGGGALFLGTIPAVLYMERVGRRFVAIAALPGCFLGLVLISASYFFDVTTHVRLVEGLYLSGLIIYMLSYGPYACLTWVIPSDVYPTYLRSYGMTTSDAMVFLGSFIITFNFSAMQVAMTKPGLTLGFFGGITVIGWFYQILFMPEVKNMTLEEVGQVFSKPTGQLVRENVASSTRTLSLLVRFRFAEAIKGSMAPPRKLSAT
ncbi:fructose symporter [Elasticomyces elasticus]|nr:fructose symporter [Elasticomyces elasticus]